MFGKPPQGKKKRNVRPKTPRSSRSRPGSAKSHVAPDDEESSEDELGMEVLRKSIILLQAQVAENEKKIQELKSRPGIAAKLAKMPPIADDLPEDSDSSSGEADGGAAPRERDGGGDSGGGDSGGGSGGDDEEEDEEDAALQERIHRVRREEASSAWEPRAGPPPARRPRERTVPRERSEPRYGSRGGGRRLGSASPDGGRPRPRAGWAEVDEVGVGESKEALY